jgi:hypothetical protein
VLQLDEVVPLQRAGDLCGAVVAGAEPPQQAAVQAGVAEADARARKAGRVECRAEHLDDLDRAAGRLGADQLHPGLEELALLAALGRDRTVRV